MDHDIIKQLNSSNCSIYLLSNGFVDIKNSSLVLGSSYNYKDFLPSYYFTNCTLPDPDDAAFNRTFLEIPDAVLRNDWIPKSTVSDADSFVATLFTISGICIAFWMLLLLMCISPRERRIPLSTQLATLLYVVLSTITLVSITNEAEHQYNKNLLDVIRIHSSIYFTTWYKVFEPIAIFSVYVAFLDLVYYMASCNFHLLILVTWFLLLVSFFTVHCYSLINFSKPDLPDLLGDLLAFQRWNSAEQAVSAVWLVWCSVALYWYTCIRKSRKISYSSEPLYLGILTWVTIACGVTVSILCIVYYSDLALISWLKFLPGFVNVCLLSLMWCWVQYIESLEKKCELVDILGRRISVDTESFSSTATKNRSPYRARIFSFFTSNLFKKHDVQETSLSSPDDTALSGDPSDSSS